MLKETKKRIAASGIGIVLINYKFFQKIVC